ncbi:hypothetical protein D3C85_1876200 [compost metagenome]
MLLQRILICHVALPSGVRIHAPADHANFFMAQADQVLNRFDGTLIILGIHDSQMIAVQML